MKIRHQKARRRLPRSPLALREYPPADIAKEEGFKLKKENTESRWDGHPL
ncbi:MAG: hypothetical protein ACLFUH_09115 [Bacteroidales bacterium]